MNKMKRTMNYAVVVLLVILVLSGCHSDSKIKDDEKDKIYKMAFRKAVTNQIPIINGKEEVYYKDILPESEKFDEASFLRLVKQSDYYYQDFDGDGLPELTVNSEGPCVLKYNPESECVYLYYQKGRSWNLLGTGQMFYYSDDYVDHMPDEIYDEYPEDMSVILREYAIEEVEQGEAKQKVTFYNIMTSEPDSDWVNTYKVSTKENKVVKVNEEDWNELTKEYFTVIGDAPHPMSFAQVFGEKEEEKPLPMNEETGEEWEAYKKMLKGDFSLVDDDSWGSLQSKYEESLESGNGRCNWSYFLMDFNQDGCKEMCIKYYEEGVNNTAFFRYEDGQVKMWGSYNSGDSHGYEMPLTNGKMISVYWYMNDKTIWINRLNSQFHLISEASYSSEVISDELQDTLPEENYYYSYQDYYVDGQLCGTTIELTQEEMEQVEAEIKELYIPENKWKKCSVFTPMPVRPEIPSVG